MNEKRQGDNRPYAAQRYIIASEMYPAGHPYGHTVIGDMQDLTAASLGDVQEFFRKYYAPSNASLTLSGNFDPAVAKVLINKYFGPIPAGEPITRIKTNVPVLDGDRVVVREERVPTPKLTLVWHAPAYFQADEAPLEIAAAILADGENSRLYKKLVREDKVASRLSAYVDSGELASLFVIEVLAAPDVPLTRLRDTVLDQIRKLGESGPTESEINQRRAGYEYQFVTELERIGGFGGKADRLNRYNTFLGDPSALTQDFARYQKVGRTDVKRVAKEWLEARHHLEIHFQEPRPKDPVVTHKPFDRGQAPELTSPAPGTPVAVPPIQHEVLPSGLPIYVVNAPSLPKVEMVLLVKGSDVAETEASAGTSYLTAVTVNEGTKTRTTTEIQEELASLGADLTTEGGRHGSLLSISVLKRHVNDAFTLFADIITNPTFPEPEVELAKRLRLAQIAQEAGSPAQLSLEIFPRLLFRGHAAGVPDRGSATSIAAIGRDALAKSHATYWVPSNAALLLVGDITLPEAKTLVSQHLAAWQKNDAAPSAAMDPSGSPHKIYLIDSPGAAQSQIRIGSMMPGRGTPQQVALDLATGVLGGTFSSRLNLNLREDKGYTYGAFTTLVQNATYGYWSAAASVQTSSTVPALIEFRKEIEGLQGPMPEAELDGLKKSLTRSYLSNFETLHQVTRQIAPLVTAGVSLDYLQNYTPAVLNMSDKTIIDTAKQHMQFKNATILVIGDLSLIEAKIRALGWADVEIVDAEGKTVPPQSQL